MSSLPGLWEKLATTHICLPGAYSQFRRLPEAVLSCLLPVLRTFLWRMEDFTPPSHRTSCCYTLLLHPVSGEVLLRWHTSLITALCGRQRQGISEVKASLVYRPNSRLPRETVSKKPKNIKKVNNNNNRRRFPPK